MSTYKIASLLSLILLSPACSEGDRRGQNGAPDFAIGTVPFDAAGAVVGDLVYAHSATVLYGVDPDTLALKTVGPFQFSGGSDEITDIAIDRDGKMIGISRTRIYAIDKATAACTFMKNIVGADPNTDGFNGLSFIAAGSGTEMLVAASTDGSLVQIDLGTGGQHIIGGYGNGWRSSGDLVSVEGATYATVKGGIFDVTDTLVTVNPQTGQATVVGSTGYANIWGLGYWKRKLFGFTQSDGMITIDVATGHATPITGGSNITWWGAGVTTAAPTTVQ